MWNKFSPLGGMNQIVDDLDSDKDEMGPWLKNDLDSGVDIRFQLRADLVKTLLKLSIFDVCWLNWQIFD